MTTKQVIALRASIMRAQRAGDTEEAARLEDELGSLFRTALKGGAA
jgi:hypothetical protein